MPLTPEFKHDLDDACRQLSALQRRLAALAGQADFDGLPPEIEVLIKRKNGNLGNALEDLGKIPERVAEVEARK
jgi:hypothetical protein